MATTRDTQELPGMKRAPISPIDKHPGGTLFREEEVKRGMREPLDNDQDDSDAKDTVEKRAPFKKRASKQNRTELKNAVMPKEGSRKTAKATPKKKRGKAN